MVLSLILPVGYVGLNKKVCELNDKIVSFYGNMDQVMISYNSNFADSSGRLNRTLYRDEIRLSVEHGVKVLASNLKHCVFRRHPRLLRSAPEHNRGLISMKMSTRAPRLHTIHTLGKMFHLAK